MTDKSIYDIFVAKEIDSWTRDYLVYSNHINYYFLFNSFHFKHFLLSYRIKLLKEKIIFETIESIMKLFKRRK